MLLHDGDTGINTFGLLVLLGPINVKSTGNKIIECKSPRAITSTMHLKNEVNKKELPNASMEIPRKSEMASFIKCPICKFTFRICYYVFVRRILVYTVSVTDTEERVRGVNRGHLLRVRGAILELVKRSDTKIVVFESL